jgi:hypothetical protein
MIGMLPEYRRMVNIIESITPYRSDNMNLGPLNNSFKRRWVFCRFFNKNLVTIDIGHWRSSTTFGVMLADKTVATIGAPTIENQSDVKSL